MKFFVCRGKCVNVFNQVGKQKYRMSLFVFACIDFPIGSSQFSNRESRQRPCCYQLMTEWVLIETDPDHDDGDRELPVPLAR